MLQGVQQNPARVTDIRVCVQTHILSNVKNGGVKLSRDEGLWLVTRYGEFVSIKMERLEWSSAIDPYRKDSVTRWPRCVPIKSRSIDRSIFPVPSPVHAEPVSPEAIIL